MSDTRREPAQQGAETSAPPSATDAAARRVAIGARLRAAREMAGLSQGQVARLLGLHRPTVTELEAGRRRLPAEELTEYARLYAVSTAWLTGVDHDAADPSPARLQLAARELSKLKPQDLERVLQLLAALRTTAPDAQ